MLWATTFLFALALSLDSLGVGIAYGLQKIKISPVAQAVICICSAAVLMVSMLLGQLLTTVIAVETVKILGAGLLIGLGTFSLIKSLLDVLPKAGESIFRCHINSLGIVIQVLKEPASADADRSGVITGREAFLLGLALALDSCGAGIAAALLGLQTLATSVCVGLGAFVFISLGQQIGQRLGESQKYRKIALVPGVILLGIGIGRLYF